MARSGTPASPGAELGGLLYAESRPAQRRTTASKDPSRVGRSAAVADQQDGGHGAEATRGAGCGHEAGQR